MSTPSGGQEPHRGTMILVLGILALVVGGVGLILGPIAWIMGNNDMKKIRAGQMDPTGEQTTSIGRILGMVATILNIVSCCIVIAVWGVLIPFVFVAADRQQQDLQRKFDAMPKGAPDFKLPEIPDEPKP
jgi:hypothetical protein